MKQYQKKRYQTPLFLILTLFLVSLTACGSADKYNNLDQNKITVIATLFPQYDFARQIAGEYANVVLLLPPGMESHSFDPSPADIIAIQNADIFLYTGPYMENWAADVIEGIGEETSVVDLSLSIPLAREEEIEAEYESIHKAEGDGHEEHEHNRSSHNHTYDPHIWTNPVYAKIMAGNIADALIEKDPAHKAEYEENAKKYVAELEKLDAEIREAVLQAECRELFFGGRFAMYYFTREYGLSYESVYDSCSSETEPSVQSVIHMIKEIKEKEIPVVYYEELVDPKTARTIAEETGCEMLLYHSCHSVTKRELKEGVTYLTLMWGNLENLKAGLYRRK